MLLFASIVMLLVAWMLTSTVGLPRLNAVSVLALVWIPILIASNWPGVLNPGLSHQTALFLLVGLAALCVGALAVPIVSGWRASELVCEERKVDWRSVERAHTMFTLLLLVHAALQVYEALPAIHAAGGFKALFTSSQSTAGIFKIQLAQTQAAASSATFSAGGAALGILNYLTFLGMFSIFTGALLWLRRRRWLAIVPLVVAAAYSFVSLQRTTFAMTTLIFVMSVRLFRQRLRVNWDEVSHRRGIFGRNPYLTMAGLAVVGAGVLLIPLSLRNAGTARPTGVQSLVQYLVASVGGLNERFLAGSGHLAPPVGVLGVSGPSTGFGSYTFTNLFSIFGRLGFPVPNPPVVYNFFQIDIMSKAFTTNTATSFFDYFLDFGWVGLIAFPMALGGLISRSQMRPTSRAVVGVPMAAILLVVVIWSFFVNALTRDVRYLFLLIFAASMFKWSSLLRSVAAEPARVQRTASQRQGAISG